MQLQQIFTKTRRLTNTNTITLTDSRLLDLTNETYLDIQRTLAENEIEVLGTIAKADLVANQTSYQIPNNLLTILRIEINYDDPADETKWIKLSRTDIANLPVEWYKLVKSQPKTKPLYDLFSNVISVFPTPQENKTQGLRLWYIERQPDFVSANDQIPQVLEKYWEVFAYGNAFRYFEEVGHIGAQRKFELYQLYLNRMVEDYKTEVIEPLTMSIYHRFGRGVL